MMGDNLPQYTVDVPGTSWQDFAKHGRIIHGKSLTDRRAAPVHIRWSPSPMNSPSTSPDAGGRPTGPGMSVLSKGYGRVARRLEFMPNRSSVPSNDVQSKRSFSGGGSSPALIYRRAGVSGPYGGSISVHNAMPPTMAQAEHLVIEASSAEEFQQKAQASNQTIEDGQAGRLVIRGPGLGLLAKTPWIRDKFAQGFFAKGLQVTDINGSWFGSSFEVKFKRSAAMSQASMGAFPILAVAVVAGLVILILAELGWLINKLSLFLTGSGPGESGGILDLTMLAVLGVGAYVLTQNRRRRT